MFNNLCEKKEYRNIDKYSFERPINIKLEIEKNVHKVGTYINC